MTKVAFGGRGGRGRVTGFDHRVVEEGDEGGVEILTFDNFCAQQGIRPDIVKIDVYGSEGRVLDGMHRVLREGVRHLFCELHANMFGYSAADLVAMLEGAGLEVAEFTRHREEDGGEVVPIGAELLGDPEDHVLYARRPDASS